MSVDIILKSKYVTMGFIKKSQNVVSIAVGSPW
jgi:hypothetical protein